jgi:hypothetical protein
VQKRELKQPFVMALCFLQICPKNYKRHNSKKSQFHDVYLHIFGDRMR